MPVLWSDEETETREAQPLGQDGTEANETAGIHISNPTLASWGREAPLWGRVDETRALSPVTG